MSSLLLPLTHTHTHTMATPHARRPRAQKVPLSVSQLRLPLKSPHSSAVGAPVAAAGNAVSPLASGASTAPAALDAKSEHQRPGACPTCQSRHIARWRYWLQHDEWIWHCHHLSRSGRPFCGHMWLQTRPIARCDVCGLILTIEQHGSVLGYWCGFCQDFSH